MSTFIGQKYSEVAQKLKQQNIDFRIRSRDGQAYCGTCDCKPGRYNFDVKDDIIVAQVIE